MSEPSVGEVLGLLADYAEAAQRHYEAQDAVGSAIHGDGFDLRAGMAKRAEYGDTESPMLDAEDKVRELDPAHLRALAAALITQAPALARDYSAALGEIERMTAERDAYRDALSIYADLSTNYRGKVTQLTLDALWGQAREAIVKYGCVNCAAQTFEDGMVCCWTCGRELPRAALAPAPEVKP